MNGAAPGKTMLRRLEQYQDRWSSFGATTGIISLSDHLSPDELRRFEIFADYDDRFLERIGPDVSVALWDAGAVLFEAGSYIDLAFFVANGEVEAFVGGDGSAPQPIFDLERTSVLAGGAESGGDAGGTSTTTSATVLRPWRSDTEVTFLATMDFDVRRGSGVKLGPGELFGEIGALSGWPQSLTVRTLSRCELIQIRLPALRLMRRKSKALKERLDSIYRERSLAVQLKSTPLFRECNDFFIEALKETVELVSCEPDEAFAEQGEPAEALYLVRSGFVKLTQSFGEGEMVVSYLSKGMTLGEVELLIEGVDRWQVTARSLEYAELVELPRAVFDNLLDAHPRIREALWATATERLKEIGYSRRRIDHSEFVQVALDSGLVQGNSILAIDLSTCTRCDDCVRACAATHGGRPRFVREGDKYGNLQIAKSCYHCRDPVCLVGCPTGAIHRAGSEEVVEIDEEICIGCSTCASNCPYDAIVMHDTETVWPDDMVPPGLRGKDRRLASKCDLCHGTGHGPACVSNCPHGCAYRVGSLEEFEELLVWRPERS